MMSAIHDDLGERLVTFLGADWRAEKPDGYDGYSERRGVALLGSDGECVKVTLFTTKSGEQRYAAIASYPDELSPFRPSSRIDDVRLTLAATPDAMSDAARLAREIERRLLPSYRGFLRELRSHKQQHDERIARRDAAIERLRAVGGRFPSKVYRHNEVWYRTPKAQVGKPYPTAIIEVEERGSIDRPVGIFVKLTLGDVSLETAEQIMRLFVDDVPMDVRVFLCPKCGAQHELPEDDIKRGLICTVRCINCYRSLLVTVAAQDADETLRVRELAADELSEMHVDGIGDLYACQGCHYVRLERETVACHTCYEQHRSDTYCADRCYPVHLREMRH